MFQGLGVGNLETEKMGYSAAGKNFPAEWVASGYAGESMANVIYAQKGYHILM